MLDDTNKTVAEMPAEEEHKEETKKPAAKKPTAKKGCCDGRFGSADG